jgi:hypothetical protein
VTSTCTGCSLVVCISSCVSLGLGFHLWILLNSHLPSGYHELLWGTTIDQTLFAFHLHPPSLSLAIATFWATFEAMSDSSVAGYRETCRGIFAGQIYHSHCTIIISCSCNFLGQCSHQLLVKAWLAMGTVKLAALALISHQKHVLNYSTHTSDYSPLSFVSWSCVMEFIFLYQLRTVEQPLSHNRCERSLVLALRSSRTGKWM